MFGSSAIYHSVQVFQKKNFRMIDYMMIYLVIAGSYTPICAIALEGEWRAWDVTGRMDFSCCCILKKVFCLMLPLVFYGFISINGLVVCLLFSSLKYGMLYQKCFHTGIGYGSLFHTIENYLRPSKTQPCSILVWIPWHLAFICYGRGSFHFWAIFNYLPGL